MNNPEKNVLIGTLLALYGSLLPEKQNAFLDLYYNQDLSLAEIAQNEGITRQGVHDNIKRGEAYLLELEEKLHMMEDSTKRQAALEEIKQLAFEITSVQIEHTDISQMIHDKARKVYRIAALLQEEE